jgi:hypothetical protein
MKDPLVWFPVIFPLVFVAIWYGTMVLVSRMGGWSRLARAYDHPGPFDGFRKRFVTGVMTGGPFFGFPCNYGNCLTVGADSHGLYLAVFVIFRPGHPPLFVPWSDITVVPVKGRFYAYADFSFAEVPKVRLRITYPVARQLISAAGRADLKEIEAQEARYAEEDRLDVPPQGLNRL